MGPVPAGPYSEPTMNSDTIKLPQVGDRVRFRDREIDDTGTVTDVRGDGFVNVRWSAVPIQTSHRLHELEIVPAGPTREHYAQLLQILCDPDNGAGNE